MSFNSPLTSVAPTPTTLDLSNLSSLPPPKPTRAGPTNAAATTLEGQAPKEAGSRPTPQSVDRIVSTQPNSNLYNADRVAGQLSAATTTASAATAALPRAGVTLEEGVTAASEAAVRALPVIGEGVAGAVSGPVIVGSAAVGVGLAATTAQAGNADESSPQASWRSTSPAASDRPSSAVLERQTYPNVDSHSLPAGQKAMADFNQCHPNDLNNLPGGSFKTHTGRSDAAFDALKSSLPAAPTDAAGKPYHAHHIVEQNQTGRVGTQAVQNTANVVQVPESVHNKISGYYNRSAADAGFKNADGTPANGRVRDFVGNMSYAKQREFGISTTRGAVTDDKTIPAEAKDQILKQLDNLQRLQPEDATSCEPEVK